MTLPYSPYLQQTSSEIAPDKQEEKFKEISRTKEAVDKVELKRLWILFIYCHLAITLIENVGKITPVFMSRFQ